MKPRHVTLPIVHLNGTGAAALYSAAVDAGHALRAALDATAAAGPNARDYYPAGPDAYAAAAREHAAICDALRAAIDHFMAHAERAADFGGAS